MEDRAMITVAPSRILGHTVYNAVVGYQRRRRTNGLGSVVGPCRALSV